MDNKFKLCFKNILSILSVTLVVSLMMTLVIIKPDVTAARTVVTQSSGSDKTDATYIGLDEFLRAQPTDKNDHQLVDPRQIGRKVKALMDKTGSFKINCGEQSQNSEVSADTQTSSEITSCPTLSEDDILKISQNDEDNKTRRDFIQTLEIQREEFLTELNQLKSLEESQSTFDATLSDKIDILSEILRDFDKMISVFSTLENRDSTAIAQIKIDSINTIGKYFGSQLARNVEIAVKVSQIDAPISKNFDLSELPYSPKTGELQFSAISWANLGLGFSRIHIGWVEDDDPDDESEIQEIIASDWLMKGDSKQIDLKELGLKEGAKFKFYSEMKFGKDSKWSKWYSYHPSASNESQDNKTFDFSIGAYSDKFNFTKEYVPVSLAYGTMDFTEATVKELARRITIDMWKVFGITVASAIVAVALVSVVAKLSSMAINVTITDSPFVENADRLLPAEKPAKNVATGTINTLPLRAAIIIGGLNCISGIIFAATDVLLTASLNDINYEEIDLEKQPKDRNWINTKGLYAISGFSYVSAGYFWSKPMVHWRSPDDDADIDHKAYVNEIETNKSGHDVNIDGVRMGKASGKDLLNLSQNFVVDKEDPSVWLKEGDIIWFGAEVTLGKDRIAEERFVYSKYSDYKAGYYTLGTTLMENGISPKAHFVAFGSIEKVGYEMSQFVTTANNSFYTTLISATAGAIISIANTALVSVFTYRYWKDLKWVINVILPDSNVALYPKGKLIDFRNALRFSGLVQSLSALGFGIPNHLAYVARLKDFYEQEVQGIKLGENENEESARILNLIGSKYDKKVTLYQIFYDLQEYIDNETDMEKINELTYVSSQILYTLYLLANDSQDKGE